jgi:hypothetical protein
VEHILAVVQDHAGKLNVTGLLVQKDRLYDPVQAVSLTCGTGMRHLHPDQLAEAPPHPLDLGDGRRIVHIGADEDQIVLIVERHNHVLDHRRNHRLLEPCWNHDGEGLLVTFIELICSQRPVDPPNRETAI